MAEFIYNPAQTVLLNQPLVFENSIGCGKGYVFHNDGDGVFILRGIVNNPTSNFARYQVTYNGNIAIPTGGTVGPIAVAIAINGEPRPSSLAIYTPAAVDTYGNVTCTAIITVPRGCCFTVSVRAVAGSADAVTASINAQNSNLVITRIA